MIGIGAALGLRWSEVAALRVGRLDLDAGRFALAEAHVRGTGGRNVFGPPKWKAGKLTMRRLPDLRRLNATTLVVEGIDVKTARTRLGHAGPRTTLAVYASAPASIARAAADVIGERFFGEKAKRAAGTKSPRSFRANPSEGSGASEG